MNSLSFSKAIFLLFFMLLAKVLTAQPQLPGLSITGPAIACYGSYGVYDIEGLLPSGVTRFEWSGADFSEMPGQVIQGGILISNSPTAIVHFPLFWYISYVHLHLNIYVNNILVHSQTVDIGLNYIYVNAHLNSGTLCPGATPYQCKQEACVGTTITYSTQLAAAAADISWDVEGATSYIVNPDNSITVLWGEIGQGRLYATYNPTDPFNLFNYPDPCIINHQQVACVNIQPFPHAAFITDPPPQEVGILKICKGQAVNFINQSTDASNYQWILGNNITDSPNPVNIYDTPGTYEVLLRASNGCECLDTATMTIVVEDAYTPNIDCKSIVCAGDTATYHTDADCGVHIWSINELGLVLAGGSLQDDFITVQWHSGGTGEVQLRVENCPAQATCNEATILHIPVIDNQIEIQGPAAVCINENAVYSIPNYQGALIAWSPIGGTIISGQGTSQASINWPQLNTSDQRRVIVNYLYCFLGCSGRDTLDVFVRPVVQIKGDIEVCANSVSHHQAIGGEQPVECHWTAFSSNSAVIWSSTIPVVNVDISWTQSGVYTLMAIPADPLAYCTDTTLIRITIYDAPPAPAGIAGDVQICTGQTYYYEPEGVLQGAGLNWQIVNGADTFFTSGTRATVTWSSAPPYQISLAQTSIAGGCLSPPAILTPSIMQAAVPVNGPAQACTSSTAVYWVDASGGDIQWAIHPADAGIIISGQHSNSIEVQWNKSGSASVSILLCNYGSSLAVDVYTMAAPPEVIAPSLLCENETAEVFTTSDYASYKWRNESGNLVSTVPAPALAPGYYHVETTNTYGCIGKTAFRINPMPVPEVYISSPSFLCLDLGMPQLYALNTVAGYQYEWRRNGTLLPQTGPAVSVLQAGSYQAQTTDVNGCRALSNILFVQATCIDGGGPPISGFPEEILSCLINGPANIDIAPDNNCDTRHYTAGINNALPGSIRWYFSDMQTSSPVYGQPVSHTYAEAGFYQVMFLADFNQNGSIHTCGVLEIDSVWARADFTNTEVCAGSPMYFIDRSTYIPILSSIVEWHWNFGDPASGTANLSSEINPSHIFSQPGNYQVTLTVTSSTGCQSVLIKTVIVRGPSAGNLNLLPAYCLNTPQQFQAVLVPEPLTLQWNFDIAGGSSLLQGNNLYYEYTAIGNYIISLHTINRYGCTGDHIDTINVDADMHLLSGEILSSLEIPFCPGDSSILTPPPGGVAWQWSTGENSLATIASNAGTFSVVVTDTQGCQYYPPPLGVQLLESPSATIRAVEYNEYAVPSDYYYQEYEICEGEDVILEMITSTNCTIQWVNGVSSLLVEYTAARGSLLPVGLHDIYATVTDTISGCSVEAHFSVLVNPSPAVPLISMSPANIVCLGEPVTYSVIDPDPDLSYIWNTRQTQTSITHNTPGTFSITAYNIHNCSTQNSISSNYAEGVDMGLVPSGCYSRCNPDTICIPSISTLSAYYVSYSWYYNGEPVSNSSQYFNFIATQSGDYHLQATLHAGNPSIQCVYSSENLHLDLYNAESPVTGYVFVDVNQNNTIDAADTLVSDIAVLLQEGGLTLQNGISNDEGHVVFSNLGSGSYTAAIDTALLSADYRVVASSVVPFQHSGCDPRSIRLLIANSCPLITGHSQLNFCQGDTTYYEGATITSDTAFILQLLTASGCDSVHLVQASALPHSSSFFAFEVCSGEYIQFAGLSLPGGIDTVLTYTNSVGCDSIVHISVEAPILESNVILSACTNSSAYYNGFWLPAGYHTSFVYYSVLGCDSTVHVSVNTIPTSDSTVELSACPGSMAFYNGIPLLANTDTSFVYSNYAGCDSTVHVSVTAIPTSGSTVELSACPGSMAFYNGIPLPANTDTSFVFMSINGCDSTVHVTVSAFSQPYFSIEWLPSCPNQATGQAVITAIENGAEPFIYSINNQDAVGSPTFTGLEAGLHTFYLTDANGCRAQNNVEITAYPSLVLEEETLQTLPCNPHEIRLHATVLSGDDGNISFAWSNGETSQSITVDAAGNYEVIANNNCESTMVKYTVLPALVTAFPAIYLPNAFSPNDDGINDVFNIMLGEDVLVQDFELRIFDRWGNFVFATTSTNSSWNGAFRGHKLNPGIYVWFLEADILHCGKPQTITMKGDVLLIK